MSKLEVGQTVLFRSNIRQFFEDNEKLYERLDDKVGVNGEMQSRKYWGIIGTITKIKDHGYRYSDGSPMLSIRVKTEHGDNWNWTKDFFEPEFEGDI